MARIVIDARNMNTSTGRYARRLVEHLEKLDHTNEYIILLLKKDEYYYRPTNPNFRTIGVPYPWFSLSEQFAMARFLRTLNADLVHYTMPHHSIFYTRPYITTFHDLILLKTYNSDKNWLIFKTKQFIGRFVYKVMVRQAKRLIVPTKFTGKELQELTGADPAKIVLAYESCDSNPVSPQAYEPLKGKDFILYVGQQSDYKNIRRLMQAHQQLLAQHPQLILALAGRLTGKNGVPLQRNKAWAEAQGFKNIVFTDFVEDDQLQWLYKNTRAYVFPSLMEGFGLPALEAMGAGAPVASSSATCLPEVYGDAAHYFDPLNIDDIARATNDILTDTQLRDQLITKSKVCAAQYSWERMTKQTLETYQTVLSENARLNATQRQ